MSPPLLKSFAEGLRRVLAGGCAALVLALSVFAASPAAHNWLHLDGDQNGSDDGCAVTLFAGGVSLAPSGIAVPLPIAAPVAEPDAIAAEILLVSPRYLRQPERGPPAVG